MGFVSDEFGPDHFDEGANKRFRDEVRLERAKLLHSNVMVLLGLLPSIIVATLISTILGLNANMVAFVAVLALTFIGWLKFLNFLRGVHSRAAVHGFIKEMDKPKDC
jgi:cytochrome c biogenesis protein CcdA